MVVLGGEMNVGNENFHCLFLPSFKLSLPIKIEFFRNHFSLQPAIVIARP